MPSETDIANVALVLIGANRVANISDSQPLNDTYTEVRDALLRSHPWNFATKRQKLAQSSTDPVYEFDHAYPLPSDWIRTISVSDTEIGRSTVLYRTEIVNGQRAIVSSSSEIYIRYVYRVTDPNLMSEDFRIALEKSLAKVLAIKEAGSRSLHELYAAEARQALNAARSTDAIDSFPELRPRGAWASSRSGYRRRSYYND